MGCPSPEGASPRGGGGGRGNDPRGFCVPSAHGTPAAASERWAGRIPGHLVPKLNVNGGNKGRRPSSPGSLPPLPHPTPCPLRRLPGAEAAAAEVEVRARRWRFALPAALATARSAPASARSPARAARWGRFLDSARGGESYRSHPGPGATAAAPPTPPERAPGSGGRGARNLPGGDAAAPAPQHPGLVP